ncbi:hypothetical protein RHA1_ro02665 [Rhodococcus jostii RHA1]|uniref:Uncharacterized protein n=1 Tax=Rhodococcus jostii (strain RHA1) TaxID=101510 RepID=Q0SDB6_RHOJR|nr:hypothetical protein RHA1_ro02665 [Rhodococcus jostii RHA1]
MGCLIAGVADLEPERILRSGRKGALAVWRDAVAFKTLYGGACAATKSGTCSWSISPATPGHPSSPSVAANSAFEMHILQWREVNTQVRGCFVRSARLPTYCVSQMSPPRPIHQGRR